MILNVSGRTDIVGFYTEWFMNRYREGFVDVRNPFYPKQVSRIYFKDVDAILFCTKNPIPIVKYIREIKQPILFHVTLTPYQKDIEPNVPRKSKIIEAIKQISAMIGPECIYVRYDPIFINDSYTLNYHIKSFSTLCRLLKGYVKTIIVSFMDDYKNARKHRYQLKWKTLQETDYAAIGQNFSSIAKQNGMVVQTCAEKRNLVEYGFQQGDCLSIELAKRLTGKNVKKWNARNNKNCNCAQMVDIGVYNSCRHFCKYCYANYDEKQVKENYQKHDVASSLLIGHLEENDTIHVKNMSK